MNEAQIRKIVQQEINKSNNASRFNLSAISNHVHDGIDSLPISEDNVVLTSKLSTQLLSTRNETFTLRNVSNISRISFHYYGANNADGTPATKRVSGSGEVIFGVCNTFTGNNTDINIIPTSQIGSKPYLQSSQFVYLDSATAANTRVGVGPALAYANDPSSIVLFLNLDSYAKDALQFTVTVGPNWKLEGVLIFE